jgi:seryl-tRNA synthetase
MDKLSSLKDECKSLDVQLAEATKRVNEYKQLIEEKKKKAARLAEMLAEESKLIEQL